MGADNSVRFANARRLHQLAVFHAGGAGCFAGAAIEAAVDVLDERFAEGEAP